MNSFIRLISFGLISSGFTSEYVGFSKVVLGFNFLLNRFHLDSCKGMTAERGLTEGTGDFFDEKVRWLMIGKESLEITCIKGEVAL